MWVENIFQQINKLKKSNIFNSSNYLIGQLCGTSDWWITETGKPSFGFERGWTSSWGRGIPMIAYHHSYGNTHPELLPPLQPPRARSSFNKRSSEALSNYIYSLLGRKLPALPQCGKNWEIKINPHQLWVARSRSPPLPLSRIARSPGTLRSRI